MIDLFKDIGLPDEKLHPKFLQLKKPMMEGQRKIVLSWTEGFVDRDNKIVEEFQRTFHSAFWELYLHQFFHDQGLKVDYSKAQPDFIITSRVKFYVEAVTANIRQGAREESTRNAKDILDNLTPPHLQPDFEEQLIEAVVRYSNAIQTKTTKIKEDYYKLGWVDRDAPFVLAVSSYAQVNYGKEYYYPMFGLLYGLFFDPISREYFPFEHVPKPGSDALIKASIFDDPAMQDVSVILFSCTLTLGKLTSLSKSINNSPLNENTILIIREEYEEPHFWFQEVSEKSPELHSDGLFVFHNPNARVKLPTEVFSHCCALQIVLDAEGVLQFIGNREPMLSRINLPSEALPFDVKKALLEETFELFNRVKLPKEPNT